MTRPRIVTALPVMVKPFVTDVPVTTTRPAGDVVPSIVVGDTMVGRMDVRVMVAGDPGLPIRNEMLSSSSATLAETIASRSEPAPESALVVTRYDAARAM